MFLQLSFFAELCLGVFFCLVLAVGASSLTVGELLCIQWESGASEHLNGLQAEELQLDASETAF